ncbi:Peptidase C19 ubiquitin carboxyl-terminal hydrolase [Trinorchestia longiramus]|nr:Peptidase C19 ubiquitin carboxyl-terminal hydrolase [Trinorchestia longiramus]
MSVAAVASSLIYWLSGSDSSKPDKIRSSTPRSSQSSCVQIFPVNFSIRGDTGVSGLENVGRNWCYSNGLLQAMASCPVFCSWIEHLLRVSPPPLAADASQSSSQLTNHHDGVKFSSGLCYGAHRDRMSLIAELNAIIRGVNDANYGTGSLKGMYEALEDHGWQISEGEHDCHEMLSVLCNTIQSELESVERVMGYTQKELKHHENILSGNPSLTGRLDSASLLNVAWLPPAWQEPSVQSFDTVSGSCLSADSKKSLPPEKKANKSHLEDVLTRQMAASVRLQSKHMPFGGFFANQLQCLACGSKHAARWDRFECISLQLPADASSSDVSLVSLLESYTSPDLVEDVTCDHCSKRLGVPTKRSFNKRITIGKLPELLVLHINRSVWTDSDNATYKRNDRVRFSICLNMTAFTYTHAVNNKPAPSDVNVGGVRGLSRLVEARFSARSSTAQLPLTRKTASIASAGGVQTCANEAASPHENFSNNVPSSDGSFKISHSKSSISENFKSGSARNTSDNGTDAASQSKTKEFKCPPIVSPTRWFHSDSSALTDSSPNSRPSGFVSTYRPSITQSSSADNVSPDHSKEKSLLAEAPSSADVNSNTGYVEEENEGTDCKDSKSQTEHLHNGDASSEEISEKNVKDNSTPDGASIKSTNLVKKENSLNGEYLTENADQAVNMVTSDRLDECRELGANVNVSSLINENSDSRPTEGAEDKSKSSCQENKERSSNHASLVPERNSSSTSVLVAATGPEQSQTADTAPKADLEESGPVNDLSCTSTRVGSTTPVRQSPGSCVNSAPEASRRDEESAAPSSRMTGRASKDPDPIALYHLRAVIVHSGSASSGHFTTYRRGPGDSPNWYFTSDETVRQCAMMPSVGVEPYMLFYERDQRMPPPAGAAAKLKSSLVALSSAIPFSKSKKTSSTVTSSLPLPGDDAPEFAVPPPSATSSEAAYFSQSSMFA